jgi:SHS2 domain-containing protein
MAFYRELDHTADWAIEVWGESLPALFEHAAEALFEMQGAALGMDPTFSTDATCHAMDLPVLLVTWLNELLFLSEIDDVLFTRFDVEISNEPEPTVTARIAGVLGRGHLAHVKATTYHNLEVSPTPDGWCARVTFDT